MRAAHWLCLQLACSVADADVVVAHARDTTVAAPLAIQPDGNWDGIDGNWSTFTLRVGTPAQDVQTLLSFNSYQTWVVLPQGCEAATSPSSCAVTRGGLFNESASSTWQQIGSGIFDLQILENLGLDGNALFGYDTVGLEAAGDDGPTIQNTTVGGLAVEDFYLGIFGINPKPTNFTSYDDPSPSYMDLLKSQDHIPSISFGYTSGAPYRFDGVGASLTLGGYDKSKFVENDVVFTFAADNDRDIVVAIQGISTPSTEASALSGISLLPSPIYAYIDATVPHIWLPIEACEAFEIEFGLVYDNATELYVVNDTLHQDLLQRNPNITFTLAQTTSGGSTVVITLPYAAFDLTALPPYQGITNESYYFPIQRAQNSTQYTIGRSFLQEAYITVDYESARFNVSAIDWVEDPTAELIAIKPGSDEGGGSGGSGSSSSGSGSSSGLSKGAIAGIAVAAAVVGIALLALLFWYLRRKRRATKFAHGEKSSSAAARGQQATVFPKAELEGSYPTQQPEAKRLLSAAGSSHSMTTPSSAFGGSGVSNHSPTTTSGEGTVSSSRSGWPFSPRSESSEADSRERQVFEMPGDLPPVREADGRQLSEKEAIEHRNMVYNGVGSRNNSSAAVDDGIRPPRRINPADVTRADLPVSPVTPARGNPSTPALHRAFSFEFTDSDAELYD